MKKQIKFLGVLAVALTLGLTACNGGGGDSKTSGDGDNTSSRHKHTAAADAPWQSDDKYHWHDCVANDGGQVDKKAHDFEDKEIIKDSTCTEVGSKVVKCKVCGKEVTQEIALKEHEYVTDPNKTNVEATCTEPGHVYTVCKNCGDEQDEVVDALGHEWVDAEDQSAAVAPTCTEPGTKIQECSRCHEKQEVATEALGHDFANGVDLPIPSETETNTKGEIPFHWAKITNYSCSRGDSYRYAWSAKEVNFDYQNVAEGAEPELLDDGEEGIRFWGRPIGNAMVLSSEGRASSSNDEKIPDESVKGSRFEFDFQFDADVNDVCLSAELTPAQYTNDVFKNRSGDQEWTPGYRFIDDDNDPETPKVPEMIEGMRYIIYLDGVEVDLDESVNTAPKGRGWYQFPCKLNLTAGKHNLNIAMAGGYLHTFYQFSFEKVAPAHKHNFAAETKVDKKGEGYVDYYTATCAKEGAQQLRIPALSGTFAEGSSNKSGTRDGYLKLNSNGNSISYKFDYAGQATKAKLYQLGFMDNWSSNTSRTYTSAQNGQTLGENGCNFGIKYNDVEVEIDTTAKATTFADLLADATIDAGTGNSKAGPCLIGEVNLVNGDNSFVFTRYASYNLAISDFLLVIE